MRKRLCVILTLGLCVVAAPAVAQRGWYAADQHFRLRIGGFQPEGDSDYWRNKEVDFTGEAAELEDLTVGFDYRVDLAPHFGLLFSGSLFDGQMEQTYRNFVDSEGADISHDTRLEIVSTTVGGVFLLTGPRAPVRPYVGAGGGIYFWQLQEDGDFIDFTPPPPVIFGATLDSEGTAFGWYLLGGFEVPVGRNWSFFAEGRWHSVEDDLADELEDLGTVDLSGTELGAGISWRF